jgi:rubrerythrin
MADQNSVTIKNLEAAFAGESMAHIKYRYFAKLARAAGAEDVAKIFEATADQEVMHAFGHLDLLYPKAKMTPAKALEIAIEGETYEYTEMYPNFRHLAIEEGNQAAVAELSRSPNRKSMPKISGARWKWRPSASLRWPRSRSGMPTITAMR